MIRIPYRISIKEESTHVSLYWENEELVLFCWWTIRMERSLLSCFEWVFIICRFLLYGKPCNFKHLSSAIKFKVTKALRDFNFKHSWCSAQPHKERTIEEKLFSIYCRRRWRFATQLNDKEYYSNRKESERKKKRRTLDKRLFWTSCLVQQKHALKA